MPLNLASLGPLIAPLVQEGFDNVFWPQVVAEVAKISSPDIQVFMQALLPGLKSAIDTEIAKLGK
jgi:hypothetical protein